MNTSTILLRRKLTSRKVLALILIFCISASAASALTAGGVVVEEVGLFSELTENRDSAETSDSEIPLLLHKKGVNNTFRQYKARTAELESIGFFSSCILRIRGSPHI